MLQPVTNFQTAMASPPSSPFGAGSSGSLMLLQATYTPGIPLWPLNVTTVDRHGRLLERILGSAMRNGDKIRRPVGAAGLVGRARRSETVALA